MAWATKCRRQKAENWPAKWGKFSPGNQEIIRIWEEWVCLCSRWQQNRPDRSRCSAELGSIWEPAKMYIYKISKNITSLQWKWDRSATFPIFFFLLGMIYRSFVNLSSDQRMERNLQLQKSWGFEFLNNFPNPLHYPHERAIVDVQQQKWPPLDRNSNWTRICASSTRSRCHSPSSAPLRSSPKLLNDGAEM